ncbi:MAG TPA: DUF4402 domain-containing protein [Lentimicrobium sp.]|jgi:hypothetical protein|nr:DUF4402 domain-containing protein [Lentimicrobium sp.]
MINRKHIIAGILVMLWFLSVFAAELKAQEQPPRPMQVSTFQHLSFGSFIAGDNGGTVTISADGNRSVTGDVVPLFMGGQYHPAVFEVEANPGAIVHLVFGPGVILSGSNGGQLLLRINTSSPLSPFINTISPPFRSQVRVGGSLTTGNALANPPGEYTGHFFVTFIQE